MTQLVGVCDNSKGDEADAERNIDIALHVGWVLGRGVLHDQDMSDDCVKGVGYSQRRSTAYIEGGEKGGVYLR